MTNVCKDCDFYCDGACLCPSMDKWYACPIESSKPENQQALREYAEQVRKKTNGDVIMAMFPNCLPCIGTEMVDTDIALFEREWWDAPYEKDYISKDILDKILTDIDQKQYDFMNDEDYAEGIRFGLMLAYQIIDKYKAGGSKDTNKMSNMTCKEMNEMAKAFYDGLIEGLEGKE